LYDNFQIYGTAPVIDKWKANKYYYYYYYYYCIFNLRKLRCKYSCAQN
jgi:hypothetical protein